MNTRTQKTKKMITYKLTTQDGTTHGGYQWSLPSGKKPGKWHETSGEGDLCGPGWLHYYHHPLLAVLLNPIHASIADPILWEVEVSGNTLDDKGLKAGATRMRILRKLPLPEFAKEQRIAFGIYCAQEVFTDEAFAKWACDWLDNVDRSAARAAWAAAEGAAWAARAAKPIDLIALAQKAKAFKNF